MHHVADIAAISDIADSTDDVIVHAIESFVCAARTGPHVIHCVRHHDAVNILIEQKMGRGGSPCCYSVTTRFVKRVPASPIVYGSVRMKA